MSMKKITCVAMGLLASVAICLFTSSTQPTLETRKKKVPEMMERAHSLMTTVIDYYFGKSDRGCWLTTYPYHGGEYWDGDALVWGQGAGLSGFVAMREATRGTNLEKNYRRLDNKMYNGIQKFFCLDHGVLAYSVYPDSGNDRFYDDNAWIGIDMVDWYTETKNKRYLEQAVVVWNYLIDHGWNSQCGGGIRWQELGTPTFGTNTCSTAPTAVLGCKLYQTTGDKKYLDWAIKCYDYLLSHLQDKSDHLFYDNIQPDGSIGRAKFSYNSGQPLQAACLLYKITKEQRYLDEAHLIAQNAHEKWFKPYHSQELNESFNILKPGHFWFHTIMARGYFELYSIDNDRRYVNDIEKSMLHAWSSKCHQSNNLINDSDLSGDTPQTKWDILQQGAVVEMYARLATLAREGR